MTDKLAKVAEAMVVPGKGILAADESTGSIKKRFDSINIPSTEENRRDYREMLFSAKEGMSKYISGVILFDETIRQKGKNGMPLVDVIKSSGVIPGIKLDAGAKPIALSPKETVTEGLDGLRERIKDYVALGAQFAKWRAVIDIGPGLPSHNSIHANAHALARYAALCQEGGLVPIVEPEVLLDGSHTVERCEEVTEKTLKITFAKLFEHRVHLEGMILKPSMVVSGKDNPRQAGV